MEILSLESKLQSLLQKYKKLQKENERLKDELFLSNKALAVSKNKIQFLEQQLDVKHLGVHQLSAEEKQALLTRIEAYLKEIDNCLALLSIQ